MLPEGWKRISLQHIGMVKSGGTPSRKDTKYWGGNIPWITTAELNQTKVSRSNEYITVEGLKNSSAKIFPRGTILVAMYGQGKTRGTSSILGIEAATNQACAAIVCNENINNLYVFQYLQSQYLELRALSNGGSQDNLSLELIKNFEILLPPLPEQEKIAAILSTWDKAISTADAMLENSRQQKKTLMQQLLTGKRRLPGFKEEWCFFQAKKLFNSISIKHRPEEQLLAVTQDDGVVPRALLDRRVVMPEGDVDNYKFVKKGNFIISLRSFQGGIEYSNYNGLVSPAYTIIEKRCDIDDAFYRHYFKSSLFIGKLAIAVIGIRDGKQISYDDFADIPLPVPPLDEQRAIAAVLDAADREIALLEQKAARLREEKKALMQQLLTGKRRVRVE